MCLPIHPPALSLISTRLRLTLIYAHLPTESGSVTTCSEARVAAGDGEADVTPDRPVVLTAGGGEGKSPEYLISQRIL